MGLLMEHTILHMFITQQIMYHCFLGPFHEQSLPKPWHPPSVGTRIKDISLNYCRLLFFIEGSIFLLRSAVSRVFLHCQLCRYTFACFAKMKTVTKETELAKTTNMKSPIRKKHLKYFFT